MARDIGTARDALQTRLATLPHVIAFDVATGSEDTRLASGVIVQVFPAPPDGGNFWPTNKRGAGGALWYRFTLTLWVSLHRGVAAAQDILDGYISPKGTHTNSVQTVLEDVSGTYSDALDSLADDVQVGAFQRYVYGQLNTDSGANSLTASVPVWVMVNESA